MTKSNKPKDEPQIGSAKIVSETNELAPRTSPDEPIEAAPPPMRATMARPRVSVGRVVMCLAMCGDKDYGPFPAIVTHVSDDGLEIVKATVFLTDEAPRALFGADDVARGSCALTGIRSVYAVPGTVEAPTLLPRGIYWAWPDRL